jgi:DNA-binding NtrC family response regulator
VTAAPISRPARSTISASHAHTRGSRSRTGVASSPISAARTFVDGKPITAQRPTLAQRVIRVGYSLLVPCADVRPFERWGVRSIDGFVRGPAMQAVLAEVGRAAQAGTNLHVRGENGTGKEAVAQVFHRAGTRSARSLVAVNCAAIPHELAERLLFGAQRGAFTGATDVIGYLQEADGGTLFLDEIAELDLKVQAKLLRVLQDKKVLPLGASKPRKVDFALCSATNKDLRALVDTGAFREDLYYRLGRPAVTLPALRNRPEEIPALIAQELAGMETAPTAHMSLIEKCLLLTWRGNVRDLLTEVRIAAQAALASGNRVEARHLQPEAGSMFPPPEARAVSPSAPAPVTSEGPSKRLPRDDVEARRRIEDALRTHGGNIAATARSLGEHRTQLRRLIKRYHIAVDSLVDDGGDDPDGGGDSDD